MLASELVARALRLINVPGRGGVLSPFDQQQAFESLQEILNSEAVSKFFVPGIRRHFFDTTSGQHIYSYGTDGDFDLVDFEDPLPIKIEDAYISAGATITRNEQLDEWDFLAQGDWIITGGVLYDGYVEIQDDDQFINQAVTLTVGTRYTLRIDYTNLEGDLLLQYADGGGPTVQLAETLIESGVYEFDLVPVNPTNQQITAIGTATGDQHRIDSVSIIEKGKERVELTGLGSDYALKIIDQKRYNRRFTKGTGGRPYQMLWSRTFPSAEIRFDNAPTAGDVLVMDVLVNRVEVTELASEIRMHPEAMKWLRYELADHEAGAYGKQLSPRQVSILNEAYDKLAAGNLRMNTLAVDRALRSRPVFDINRGDP